MRESKPLATDERVCEVPPKMTDVHVTRVEAAGDLSRQFNGLAHKTEWPEIASVVRALSSGRYRMVSVEELERWAKELLNARYVQSKIEAYRAIENVEKEIARVVFSDSQIIASRLSTDTPLSGGAA